MRFHTNRYGIVKNPLTRTIALGRDFVEIKCARNPDDGLWYGACSYSVGYAGAHSGCRFSTRKGVILSSETIGNPGFKTERECVTHYAEAAAKKLKENVLEFHGDTLPDGRRRRVNELIERLGALVVELNQYSLFDGTQFETSGKEVL